LAGVDIGEVSWSATASKDGQSFPPGLNINSATGHIYGTPSVAGDYTFEVTATGKGRWSTAVMTLHVEPPLFDLELKDPGNFTAVSWTAKTFDLRSLVSYKTANINVNSIVFSATLNPVPSRVTFSPQSMGGTFVHADDYVFTVKGTFTSGPDVITASTNVTVRVTDPPEQAWKNWTIRFTDNVAGAHEYTGARDAKIAELQMFDEAGNQLTPRDVYTYYSQWNSEAGWDGNPSTILLDGLGSGMVFEFPSAVVVKKVRIIMTGTPQDVTGVQSMRSNDAGWCGNCGWLKHSSDYQPLPKPASGGTAYAAGEVVEFNLYPGAP
jgi:hypothetical protein